MRQILLGYDRMEVAAACERLTGVYPQGVSELKKIMLGHDPRLLLKYV